MDTKPIDLIVTDIVIMSRMSGKDLVPRSGAARSGIKAFLISDMAKRG
jgi:hypothetical protein